METDRPAGSGDGLQFDTAEPATSEAPSLLRCARCKKPIAADYYEVDAQVTCDGCHRDLGVGWRRGTAGKLARALAFGVGAAIAGGIGYGVVSALTGYHLALLSIGVGILVGYAVRHATAGKGGRLYQFIAAALTYLAIAGSYVPQVAEELLASSSGGPSEARPSATPSTTAVAQGASGATPPASAPSAGTPQRGPSAQPEPQPPMSLGGAIVAMGIFSVIVVVISLLAPLLMLIDSVGSGLLEIAIVGFGVWRAWRMNVAATPVVAGPFSVRAPATRPLPDDEVGDR